MSRVVKEALLFCAHSPRPEQFSRLYTFLAEKHGSDITVAWREDPKLTKGFRLEVYENGTLESVYDWTVGGRMRQLSQEIRRLPKLNGEIIPLIQDTLDNWVPAALAEEIGSVMSVGDGIALVKGLPNARYGEVLLFESGARGMVQDLTRESVGCVLFGTGEDIIEGSPVRRTGRMAGIPVGEGYIGRIINALGDPIDGKGPIRADGYHPIETPAPGIIARQPVNEPLETGILAIDSMFPIGRGQRELIIGDRQTGKTAVALDTILNQKGKNVVCIYVAIGQKASSVAQLAHTLDVNGAMAYTVVVATSASESASMQYVAPYAGCALAEYFMLQGRDTLIVYDDLSKHAVAYRTLSLLLGRSPGREAYPGDVFYLHSRLLERAAHLSDTFGGGSMTALPIVETQAGDVSAYVPTNIISITDGQIYLESSLFFAGQRPAVNVGLSVSRVGGDAQTKAMKKAVGTLRLELAQFREMQVFTQFSSDLDETTKHQLARGAILTQLLRQKQSRPFSSADMVVMLVAALSGAMDTLRVEQVEGFRTRLLEYAHDNELELIAEIVKNGVLTPELRQRIEAFSKRLAESYTKER